MMLSDLPSDLVDDVFSRLPVKSRIALRCTCKNWNTFWSFFKDRRCPKKYLHEAKASVAVMLMDNKVYLMSINLSGIHNDAVPFINRQAKLVSLTDSDQYDISKAYDCDGLMLCIMRDLKKFVVWNPYLGQTRWFEPTICDLKMHLYKYAIGYENSKPCRSYKVLRLFTSPPQNIRYQLYYVDNSKSSRDITISSGWGVCSYADGVSVKGNTYWVAYEKYQRDVLFSKFLICFDFTTELFGPCLALPFRYSNSDTITLSKVRDEQLAVLIVSWYTSRMEIWITTKIEPQVVSWSKLFLSVDMVTITPVQHWYGNFFVDEEKKVAVVFGEGNSEEKIHNIACIIGEHGCVKKLDLGMASSMSFPPLLCSYLPC